MAFFSLKKKNEKDRTHILPHETWTYKQAADKIGDWTKLEILV
jgi:hypothetical protein